MFRVGAADERLPRAGITHMVEHLALSTIGEQLYQYNGQVGADLTSLTVAGHEAEVVEHLSRCCAALRALPLERQAMERGVLGAEAARRQADPLGALLWARFGSTGFGLLSADEMAPRAATEDDVHAWADRYFTAGNAVLLLTGPPPAGLHLDLLPGPRNVDAVSELVAQELPTAFKRHSAVVAVGALMERGPDRPGRVALARHLQRRLTQRLRTELGITYSVSVDALRVRRGQYHVSAVADALPERATAVTAAMLDELDRLTENGPTAEEMARGIEELRRATMAADDAVGSLMFRRGTATLYGEAMVTGADAARGLLAVTASDVAARAAEMRASAMWLAPDEATLPDGRFQPYKEWSPEPLKGAFFAPTQLVQREGVPTGVRAGDEGVTVYVPGPRFVSITWDACTAMKHWTTGERELYSKEGFRLRLDTASWERGSELRDLIDANVPQERWVPMGAMEKPAHLPAARPARRPRRWYNDGYLAVAIVSGLAAVAAWVSFARSPVSTTITFPSAHPDYRYDPATNVYLPLPLTATSTQSTKVNSDALSAAVVFTSVSGASGATFARRRGRTSAGGR